MKAVGMEELRSWFEQSQSGVTVDPTNHLRYRNHELFGLRLSIPAEAPRAVALASHIVEVGQDGDYYGGMVCYTNWDIGTPNIERCGLRIVEQMRRGYGVTASLENAPAHQFRSDELGDTHAFLALPLLFGWDAYFMPYGARFFTYVRQNGSVFLVTDDERMSEEFLIAFKEHQPSAELPTYLRTKPPSPGS